MTGKVKEPKLEMVLAVSRFLGINLYELTQQEPIQKTPKTLENLDYNKKLLLDCSQSLMKHLLKKDIKISLEDTLSIIKEVYHYCHDYGGQTIDQSFIEYRLDKISAS